MLRASPAQVGRTEEAEALFREALEARRIALGSTDPATLVVINNLGLMLRDLGRWNEAHALLSEEVAARREGQGDSHPDTLTSMNNLASMLKGQQRWERTAKGPP